MDERQQHAADKDKMNTTNIGAKMRHLFFRHRADNNHGTTRQMTFPAMLSTIELQRLVAAMVD